MVVVGVTLVALSQLHPSLLLANTTTAGGDTGAHVMLPAFLKSHLLTHGQLTGWDPDWYDGFPALHLLLPAARADHRAVQRRVSYDVAFKLVTVLGTLTLPVCAWAFGRLAGLRDPGPACLAAATLPFLFEPELLHLRRQHPLHPGRRVLLLAQPVASPSSSSGWSPRASAPADTGPWPPLLFAATLLCHLHPGPLRRGRCRGAGCCSMPT